jgi:tetratricopeptide (TPR) repeat protein
MTLLSFLIALFIPNVTSAEMKTFIKEYSYQASEDDSRNSSRTLAMREAKRLLLEELGTYLESITEVQTFQLTKDQITMLTAGIVQIEIVEEKWDGHTYWLKSKIKADPGDVIKSIDALRKDRQKTKELEDVRNRWEDSLKEIERLRQELTTATGEKRKKDTASYNKTIKDLNATEWFEKGFAAGTSGNLAEALTAFTLAIDLNPQDAKAYGNRGVVYGLLGNHHQAITDFNKAIELNPKESAAYSNRGNAYFQIGNYQQAINDSDKAIELNPKDAAAYVNRGNAYFALGNKKQAFNEFKIGARLGHKNAQDYLRGQGIAW